MSTDAGAPTAPGISEPPSHPLGPPWLSRAGTPRVPQGQVTIIVSDR